MHFGLKFLSKPHRSLATHPRSTTPVNPASSATVAFTLTGEELKDILLSTSGQFFVPIPDDLRGKGVGASEQVLRNTLSSSTITFQVSVVSTGNQSASFQAARFPSHGLYGTTLESGNAVYYIVIPTADKTDFTCTQDMTNTASADFGLTVSACLKERIYRFQAERFNVGIATVGIRNVL